MVITYSVLSCKLATTFSSLPFQMVNHYDVPVIIQNIEHQLQENIFYEIFIKLTNIFNSLKFIYWKFCDIAHPYKLFTSQY